MPPGLTGVTEVSAGGGHTCALAGDGTVTCWGADNHGQATPPPGLTGVTEVSAGGGHTCALEGDDTVTCWGDDGSGQATVPPGLTDVTQVERRLLPHLRARGRRHGDLLGQRRLRAGDHARRD